MVEWYRLIVNDSQMRVNGVCDFYVFDIKAYHYWLCYKVTL